MNRRLLGVLAVAAGLLLAALLVRSIAIRAEDPEAVATAAGRTPWGDPDLQGTWDSTFRNWNSSFERSREFEGKSELTDAEVAELEARAAKEASQEEPPPRPGSPGIYNRWWTDSGKQTKQTSMVVDPPDGRLPPLTPEGALAKKTRDPVGYDSWEDLRLWERCLTKGGMPNVMFPRGYNNNTLIVQAPGYVTLYHEMIHEVRIVPLDGRPHVPETIRSWVGDARGRWEGDTLVVETTNLEKRVSSLQPWATFSSRTGSGEKMRLVERFKRVDANTIDYTVTVEDPLMYTRPWTVRLPLVKSNEPIFEYACHEGNYSVPAILAGARLEDAEAATKKKEPR
jgi:hypothetical protein